MAANQTQIRIAAVDATKQAFQSVQNNIGGLSSSLKRLAGPLAAVFTGFTAVDAIRETAAFSKEIDRLAQLSGVGVEQFQALAYGAERVGISTEKLADIYKDTQDKVGDFIQTGGGALADFFENVAPKIGVTADQFRKLNGADALQLYVSSLEKANLSQSDLVFYLEAIASDSSLLLPLLQNNSAAFNQLAQEARDLGVILDEQAIKQSREFANNLSRLEALSKTLGRSFGNSLIPALNDIASTLIAISKVSKQEGGLLATLLKLTEFAELFGVGVTDKVAKAKQEVLQASDAMNKALDIKPPKTGFAPPPIKKEAMEIVTFMEAARLKIREVDEAFMLENPPELISFFDEVKQRIDQFDYENIKGGKTALEEYALAAKNLANQLDNFAVRSLQGLEDALTGVMLGTMSVKDAFKSMAASIITDLARIYVQRTITGPIAEVIFGSLGSTGGGYFGGITPRGGAAIGGPLQANSPYLVGERGPELFVPSRSGSIVPNEDMMGGNGVTVNQTINVTTGVQQTVRVEIANLMPQIAEATKAAVLDARKRGGQFASTFA